MTRCNYSHYIGLDTDCLNPFQPYLDELFDLDLLCTEEGIFINIPEAE
jgi:hypothetical protein